MTSLEGIGYVPHWIVCYCMSTVWRIATSMGVHGCIYFIFTFTVEGAYVQGCVGVVFVCLFVFVLFCFLLLFFVVFVVVVVVVLFCFVFFAFCLFVCFFFIHYFPTADEWVISFKSQMEWCLPYSTFYTYRHV